MVVWEKLHLFIYSAILCTSHCAALNCLHNGEEMSFCFFMFLGVPGRSRSRADNRHTNESNGSESCEENKADEEIDCAGRKRARHKGSSEKVECRLTRGHRRSRPRQDQPFGGQRSGMHQASEADRSGHSHGLEELVTQPAGLELSRERRESGADEVEK